MFVCKKLCRLNHGSFRPRKFEAIQYTISEKLVISVFPRQLTTEVKSFLQADKYWREVVHLITEKPTALKAVTTPGTHTVADVADVDDNVVVVVECNRSSGSFQSM